MTSVEKAKDKLLTVIIPVFNSQLTLKKALDKLDEIRVQIDKLNGRLQVICVDDGSQDSSYAILKHHYDLNKNITLIKLTRNFGAIPALKTTFDYVDGDAFIFLAADLQDSPDLIPQMFEYWQNGEKYVIARRKERNDTKSANFFAWFYYKLLRIGALKDYPRHGFDLAMMDRSFLPYLKETGKHINIPLFPFWLGFKPFYIDYERATIEGKKSTWSFSKKFNLAIDSLLSFSRRPTRVLVIGGFLISICSFLYAVFIIISALLGEIEVPGFATIIVLMSFFNGIVTLFLGIVCEYLWRIFDEINGHPAAVIDEVNKA